MRYLYAVAAALLAALSLVFFPTAADAAVYETTLRLHVVAASDSTVDQTAKLAVRDATLALTEPALAVCTSRDQAEAVLRALIPDLVQAAEATAGTPAAVTLAVEDFPTRHYPGASLPAGEYLALRITLGEGGGRNWWCVLFPQLCRATATEAVSEADCVAAGLTPEAYRVITESDEAVRWRVKFRLLEVLGEWFGLSG